MDRYVTDTFAQESFGNISKGYHIEIVSLSEQEFVACLEGGEYYHTFHNPATALLLSQHLHLLFLVDTRPYVLEQSECVLLAVPQEEPIEQVQERHRTKTYGCFLYYRVALMGERDGQT